MCKSEGFNVMVVLEEKSGAPNILRTILLELYMLTVNIQTQATISYLLQTILSMPARNAFFLKALFRTALTSTLKN